MTFNIKKLQGNTTGSKAIWNYYSSLIMHCYYPNAVSNDSNYNSKKIMAAFYMASRKTGIKQNCTLVLKKKRSFSFYFPASKISENF